MTGYQIAALTLLAGFYAVYFGKLLAQKKRGIQTVQMVRGKREARQKKLFVIELLMSIATAAIVAAEVVSILFFPPMGIIPVSVRIAGLVMAMIGDGIFAASVLTMRDSWRAGIPEKDQTKLVTDGIYRFSRNPAFFAFDIVYIGVLLAFFNWILLGFTLFSIIMLHLQILQEERFLYRTFGAEYQKYQKKVCRYIGRKK